MVRHHRSAGLSLKSGSSRSSSSVAGPSAAIRECAWPYRGAGSGRLSSAPASACAARLLAGVTFAGEADARRREWALVRSRISGATRPPRKSFYLQQPERFYLQKHLPSQAANASTSRNLPCGLILVRRRKGKVVMAFWNRPGNPMRSSDGPVLHCSFCNKSQQHVAKLIAGPPGNFICNECVDICNGIVAENRILDPGHPRPLSPEAPRVFCSVCVVSVPVSSAVLVPERGLICIACCTAVSEAFRLHESTSKSPRQNAV